MEDNYDISGLKKKKRKNSRAKGSTFERDIAKKLNEKFETTEFSRSPGSGAFATTHSLPDYLKIYGDLITPQNFKFCIECKKGYNSVNQYSFFDYSSELWGFIEQCKRDADKSGKAGMLLFKQDRRPILAIIPSNIIIPNKYRHITIHKKKDSYNIYYFEELLETLELSFWFDSEESQ